MSIARIRCKSRRPAGRPRSGSAHPRHGSGHGARPPSPAVGQHDATEVMRGGCAVHDATKTLLDQQGRAPVVIDVGMRQHDSVDLGGPNGVVEPSCADAAACKPETSRSRSRTSPCRGAQGTWNRSQCRWRPGIGVARRSLEVFAGGCFAKNQSRLTEECRG
jgi:hypothetical protein